MLSGWNQSNIRKLTIDNSKVDSNLTDFPILLNLSNSSGQTDFDCVDVFTELNIDSDNFIGIDGDDPNSLLWETKVGAGTIEIIGNRLKFYQTDVEAGDLYISSKFKISGDFDIQIDFEVQGTTDVGWANGFRIITDSEWYAVWLRRESAVNSYIVRKGTDDPGKTVLNTGDLSGKMRAVRIGTSLYGYYWSGSDWQSFGAPITIETDDITLYLLQWSLGSNVLSNYSYQDNFTINSGTIIWPDGYPTRKKIAIEYQGHSLTSADDDFTGTNGDVPNEYLWSDVQYTSTDTTGDVVPDIQNNSLDFAITQYESYPYVSSRYKINGDFDIQVDYAIDGIPPADSAWALGLVVQTNDDILSAGANYAMSARYAIGNGPYRANAEGGTADTGGSSDTSGKFKITRSGTTCIMYYWGGSDWVTLHTEGSYTTDDVYVILFARVWSADKTLNTNFDNFIINSGEIKWLNKTQQCFVEIENWDQTNQNAQLWIKVPYISSGGNTELLLYYDSSHDDNTSYVGDTGESAAQNVWDDNFIAVYHMAQDPSGGANSIKDSTDTNNHGTPQGSMDASDLVDGAIGNALDFEGTDDAIELSNESNFNFMESKTSSFTISASVKTSGVRGEIFSKQNQEGTSGGGVSLRIEGDNKFSLFAGTWPSTWTSFKSDNPIVWDNVYKDVVAVYDNYSTDLFIDGAVVASTSTESLGGYTGYVNSYLPLIGARQGITSTDQKFITAAIDEVRISNIARSSEWLKTENYSNTDDLITFNYLTLIYFSTAVPSENNKVYGTSQPLSVIVTISGGSPSYTYDATLYSEDTPLGTTLSGIPSGNTVSGIMTTTSGIAYSWYVEATSSGVTEQSPVYDFYVRYLCSGTCEVNGTFDIPANIRLYKRDDGSLIGEDTSISGTGVFSIETQYNEEHYAIALLEDSATNALIYDKLIPE